MTSEPGHDAERAASPLEPRLWRHLRAQHPEPGLAHDRVKRRFWRGPDRTLATVQRTWLDVDPDKLSAGIFRKAAAQTVARPLRQGDPERDVRSEVIAQMEHKTPQFNLRNVARVTRDVDLESIEWGAQALPDRRGYEHDIAEVRGARLDPPEFMDEHFAGRAVGEVQATLHTVLIDNDWERWYGQENKREAGSLWRWVPPDGGKRTRPWPELRVTPYVFWRGRLITD